MDWQDVCRTLDLDLKGQTSASYNMRLNYEKTLLEFENYLSSEQYDADVVRGEHTGFKVFLASCHRHVGRLTSQPSHVVRWAVHVCIARTCVEDV